MTVTIGRRELQAALGGAAAPLVGRNQRLSHKVRLRLSGCDARLQAIRITTAKRVPQRRESGAALTTAVQDFDILLEGSCRYRFALLQQRDATTREIKAIVTRMADQAEVLELITRHRIGMNE